MKTKRWTVSWLALALSFLLAACVTPQEVVPARVTVLPPDIHADSRSRLPLVRREDLDEAGKRAYDAVVDPNSRLRAQRIGPAGIWLNVPELSPHIREVNWTLRNRSGLPDGWLELEIGRAHV